jgi:RNA polymerase sigma-70 factor (ECF subfamily)
VVARTTFASLRRMRGRPEDKARAGTVSDAPAEVGGADEYVLRRQVAAQLDELVAEQREALVLHFTAGMTIPEIAEMTGAPVETVRSRIRLGKAALRSALGGNDEEQ